LIAQPRSAGAKRSGTPALAFNAEARIYPSAAKSQSAATLRSGGALL